MKTEAKINEVIALLARPEVFAALGNVSETRELAEQIVEAIDDSGLFYHSMWCENCEEEIFKGVNVTTLEHKGLPVIPFDMAAQTNFSCGRCGADNYTGDFEVFVEGGSDPDELDDDEDVA